MKAQGEKRQTSLMAWWLQAWDTWQEAVDMECWKRWAEETVRIWTFLDTMLSPKHLDL
jgi:hypothetical protein